MRHPVPGNRPAGGQPAHAPPLQSLPFPLDELLDRMAEAGVRAVRFFPGHLKFPIEDWALGPILEVLEEGRVPVFFDPTPQLRATDRDMTDWDALVRICKAHPKLPVIATEQRMYWYDRTWYPALEACDNLHIELSPFWMYKGIEFVCREYGADRLIFGTRLPVRDAGTTIAQLQYAEVSEQEKQAIAGGNLRRLLAEALPGREPVPQAKREPVKLPPPDPAKGKWYLAMREAQEPFEGEVLIDTHTHIGLGAPYFLPDSEPEELVHQLDRHGFQKMLTFAFAGLMGDWTWGNDFAHQAARQFPGRILPLAAVNLWNEAEMVKEMTRCCDELGFWGVKLHPWWNQYPEAGEHVRRCCEFVHERGLIIVNHYWGPPQLLDELASEFPNAWMITGHLTLDDGYCRVVNRHENVYVGSCLPILRGEVEAAVSRLDVDKILFGSDVPDLPIPLGFGSILYARIDDEAKRKIMGLNAQRLLELVAKNRSQ